MFLIFQVAGGELVTVHGRWASGEWVLCEKQHGENGSISRGYLHQSALDFISNPLRHAPPLPSPLTARTALQPPQAGKAVRGGAARKAQQDKTKEVRVHFASHVGGPLRPFPLEIYVVRPCLDPRPPAHPSIPFLICRACSPCDFTCYCRRESSIFMRM